MAQSIGGELDYKRLTRELLVRRALGVLTDEDEGELAERLDEIWRTLDKDQRSSLERWFKGQQQAVPDGRFAQGKIGVEADDIKVRPRSVA